MSTIDRVAERMLEAAERFADVTDAAQGRGRRGRGLRARWLVMSAAMAGVYLLGANRSFNRRARTVVGDAIDRASDLPEELMGRVRSAAATTSTQETARETARPRRTTAARARPKRSTGSGSTGSTTRSRPKPKSR